jgi:hypothetical protein
VQTFYQPLFSNSPLAILFPSAISLQHFPFSNSFPLQQSFSLQQFFFLPKASYTKEPKVQKPKAKNKSLKAKAPKAKAPCPLSVASSHLYPVVNRVEQRFSGRSVTLLQEKPAFLLL